MVSMTLRFLLFGCLLSCTRATNPVIVLPEPPAAISLQVQVLDEAGTPIYGRLNLRPVRPVTPGDTGRWADKIREPYTFKDVARGAYELWTRSIGYKVRVDTFHIFTPPGLQVTVQMRPDPICLDLCDPNPELVAAARAAQDRWVCNREAASIDLARTNWAERLTRDYIRAYFGHRFRPEEVVRQLRRVGNDGECRRMAIAANLTPTSLAFSVFRWNAFTLVADLNGDEEVVLNRELKQVAWFRGGGFGYWLAPRPVAYQDRRLDSLVYKAVLDSLFRNRRTSEFILGETTIRFVKPGTITVPTATTAFAAFPQELVDRLAEKSSIPLDATALPVAGKRIVKASELKEALAEGGRTFRQRYPEAAGMLNLSPIAWSDDERSALVFYSWWCGEDCGEGRLVLVEWAPDGTWTATRRFLLWVL